MTMTICWSQIEDPKVLYMNHVTTRIAHISSESSEDLEIF